MAKLKAHQIDLITLYLSKPILLPTFLIQGHNSYFGKCAKMSDF